MQTRLTGVVKEELSVQRVQELKRLGYEKRWKMRSRRKGKRRKSSRKVETSFNLLSEVEVETLKLEEDGIESKRVRKGSVEEREERRMELRARVLVQKLKREFGTRSCIHISHTD